MQLSERLSSLPAYPFPRLRQLLNGVAAGNHMIDLSIGEPRQPMPDWVGLTVSEFSPGFASYPPNAGTPELLEVISGWLRHRYGVEDMDPKTRILALNGTREGLFNASLALCPTQKKGKTPYVLIPNPFYPPYAAGATLAGAKPYFVPASRSENYLPDFASLPSTVLERTALLYLCSPANPQGVVAPLDYLKELVRLAEHHGFRILADECYSDIYRHKPPPGALEAAVLTNANPETVAVFHSLSKRSGLPGLRSGFVAGGTEAITAMKKLRTYGGAPVATPLLAASAKAWVDQEHVEKNRAAYCAKYQIADEILGGFAGYMSPEAGLFLWLNVGNGEETALRLWQQAGLRVVPGKYLGRTVDDHNPGSKYIRVALVASDSVLRIGLERLRACI